MIEVRRTAVFSEWLKRLRDDRASKAIERRIYRLSDGNPGDVRPVGSGVSELRIDYGPGYRVYFIRRGESVMLLLCGGDKSSQVDDIKRAKSLAEEM